MKKDVANVRCFRFTRADAPVQPSVGERKRERISFR